MDTVTESDLAIALAREGGIGDHPQELHHPAAGGGSGQGEALGERDDHEPDHPEGDALLGEALALMEKYRISGVPITRPDGTLVGILTNRDIRFAEHVDRRSPGS